MKSENINTYAENITKRITTLTNKHVPNRLINAHRTDTAWLSTHVKKLIRKKKRLYDKYKKSNNINHFETYKQFKNLVTREIRKSKQEVLNILTENLASPNTKQNGWWKTLKHFIKPDQTDVIPPLNKNGQIYTEEKEKANILNNFFTEQTLLDDSQTTLPQTVNNTTYKLDSIIVTPEEVRDTLKSLPFGKAAGPDLINNRLLKELAQPLALPLSDLFNLSLSSKSVPNIWKEANVSPIHKKNHPSDVSSYRPISILSTVSKVLEKFCINTFLTSFETITSLQLFNRVLSQVILLDIYNTFCKALDEGREVCAIFCDISKAFDRVWHKGLLFKLESAGVSGSLLTWFSDYLNDRKQRVVLPGASSSWTSVKAGVPQGSILGPLLFLLYINDIVEDMNSSIRLFADDTSLYIIVDDPIQAAEQLNLDLAKIHHWADKWLVTFNPGKSEYILLSRKHNKPYHPPVLLNQTQIAEVNSHKHLGITFSNDCTWHEHLKLVKSKAWKRINIMRKLKFQLDRKSLQTIYFSFIRPLLEYAEVVWNDCTQYESN